MVWVEIAATVASILVPEILKGEARHEARMKGFQVLGELEKALIEGDPGATPEFVKKTVEDVLKHCRVGSDEIKLYPNVYKVWTEPIPPEAPEAKVAMAEFFPKEVVSFIPWAIFFGLTTALVIVLVKR